MRHAHFVTIGLSVGAIVAACGGSVEDIPPPGAIDEPEPTPQAEPAPEPEPEPEPPAKQCVAKCTADSQCANSCPATQSGVSCCDVPTGTCYTNGSGICPAPPIDEEGPPAGY